MRGKERMERECGQHSLEGPATRNPKCLIPCPSCCSICDIRNRQHLDIIRPTTHTHEHPPWFFTPVNNHSCVAMYSRKIPKTTKIKNKGKPGHRIKTPHELQHPQRRSYHERFQRPYCKGMAGPTTPETWIMYSTRRSTPGDVSNKILLAS